MALTQGVLQFGPIHDLKTRTTVVNKDVSQGYHKVKQLKIKKVFLCEMYKNSRS